MSSMKFLKLLLSSGLIFLATAIVTNEHWEDIDITYRLLEHIQPSHYDVNIIFHNEGSIFYGESNITIHILRYNTSNIDFYSKYVNIDNSTTLTHEISKKIYVPLDCSCYPISHICVCNFDTEISIGSYILKLNFIGDIYSENSNGIFETTYVNNKQNHKCDRMFAAGDFQQTAGLQWIFPCWDELIYKTTFNISVYHSKNSIAVSNMPIKSKTNVNADMMMWTHFQTTPPMSTYLMAIMVSELVHFSNNDNNIQMWCRDWHTALQLNFALNIAETTTSFLKDYFKDIKYFHNISKWDHVAIPGHRNEGLTNWGLIFYSEKAIIYDEKSNSIQRMMEVASLVSRKVVHQWFGNVVTPSNWSYIWLNEGIATFLGVHAVDKIFPHFRMMDLLVVQTRHKSLHMETKTNMPPVELEIIRSNDIKLFSSFRYIKASAIFRMLHLLLTNELFQESLNNYLIVYMLRSASPDDLWDIMQFVLDKSNHKYKIMIKELMDTWITQSHYPVLKMLRNYNNGRTMIWSEMGDAAEQNEWKIPMTYATQTHPNFNITDVQEWLSQKSFLYLPSIDRNDWIIINLQQIGYYRVMYDRENWQRIAKYLNSDEFNKIHVLNRAQIIDDAYHFLIANQLDFDIFKELTRYLSHETDYIAWYPMFKIFEYMMNIFLHPEATFIKVHMRNIVCDLLKKIGYDDKPHEDVLIKSLREEAAEWACLLGDENCREIAHSKLQNYLTNVTLHKVSKKWILCGGLMIANSTTSLKVRQLYFTISDEVILKYLPCIKELDTIWTYLQVIKLNEKIPDDDYNNLFFTVIAFHANNDITLISLFAMFERVRPRNLSFLEIMETIIKYMYTEEQFEMINVFVEINAEHLISSVESEIEKHMSEMKNMLGYFQNSTKSLDHSKSMNVNNKAFDTLVELMYAS